MAATKIFSDLHKQLSNTRVRNAQKWLRKQARAVSVNPNNFLSDSKMTSRPMPGRMYLFNYFPKGEATLPYWDQFPLIFYMPEKGKLFQGLNLHYLPHILRARLMDALYDTAINTDNNNQSTQLLLSYEILKSASSLSLYKPTFKRYLKDQMKSRFNYIPPQNWDIAMMLPLARFHKASINKVYRDSRSNT